MGWAEIAQRYGDSDRRRLPTVHRPPTIAYLALKLPRSGGVFGWLIGL